MEKETGSTFLMFSQTPHVFYSTGFLIRLKRYIVIIDITIKLARDILPSRASAIDYSLYISVQQCMSAGLQIGN